MFNLRFFKAQLSFKPKMKPNKKGRNLKKNGGLFCLKLLIFNEKGVKNPIETVAEEILFNNIKSLNHRNRLYPKKNLTVIFIKKMSTQFLTLRSLHKKLSLLLKLT